MNGQFKFWIFTICLLILFPQLSQGAEPQVLKLNATTGYMYGQRVNFDQFIAPNEENPARILPFLKEIPPGAYISIGTERSFMSASMLSPINLLVILDVSEAATVFSRINVLLLKIADSRSDYVYLRFRASLSDWNLSATKAKLTEDEKALLSVAHYNWWKSEVRENTNFSTFNRNPRWRLGFNAPFKNANYLFYEENFRRIQALAKANRIWIYNMNVEDISKLNTVLKEISAIGLTVSVWDESNASAYFKSNSSEDSIVEALLPFTQPTSVHLSTLWDNLLAAVNPRLYKQNGPWHQFAHTFGFLKQYERTYTSETLIDSSSVCLDVLKGDFNLRLRERPQNDTAISFIFSDSK